MAVRTPAPSPVSLSQPHAPRCSIRTNIVSASRNICQWKSSKWMSHVVNKQWERLIVYMQHIFPVHLVKRISKMLSQCVMYAGLSGSEITKSWIMHDSSCFTRVWLT